MWGDERKLPDLPAHAVRLNLDIGHLISVEAVHRAPGSGLKVVDVLLIRPNVVHRSARNDRHHLAGWLKDLHVREAHVAVELDGAVLEN